MNWIRKWFTKRAAPVRTPRRVVLRLEQLERREVMTVTFHGGAILPAIEVQGLYYGSAWSSGPQKAQLETSLQSLATGSFLDNLTSSYGVGHGSFSSGVIDGVSLAPNSSLNDSTIRSDIQAKITAGILQPTDANRLYVVYVEPSIEVVNGSQNSIQNFAGYHDAFLAANGADIHYAVIATPYGTVNNGSANPELGPFGEMTMVTSHEVAESATNPNGDGWYDANYPIGQGEIGDIYNGRNITLNGYQVQKIAGINDQALVPTGALFGPFVAVVNSTGIWRYSSSAGWRQLSGETFATKVSVDAEGNVVAAISGNGIWRWEDITIGGWTQLSPANPTQVGISGDGTIVAAITGTGVFRYENATAWTQISTANASSVAIGGGAGNVAIVNSTGIWRYEDNTSWRQLSTATNTTQVGIDEYGDVVAAITGAGVWRWRDITVGGWTQISTADASSVAIAGNGNVAIINSTGVWRNEGSGVGTWLHLPPEANPTQVSIDDYGDVVGAFTGSGVLVYQDATGTWGQLSTADVSSLGVGG
jgi:hypothetical protein